MRMLNAHRGIVRRISGDRTQIEVGLPGGGTISCKNEGFDIGQAVCILIDALGKRVIRVLPKEIADLQVFLGLNPELQEALKEADLEYNTLPEEDSYDEYGSGEGSADAKYFDSICTDTGDDVPRRDTEAWPEYLGQNRHWT